MTILRVIFIQALFILTACAFNDSRISGHGHIIVDNRSRGYLLHVPPSYDGSRSMPLLVALHGVNTTPGRFEAVTGMSRKADEEGFMVVYPQGSGRWFLRGWLAVHCCPLSAEGLSDTDFLITLIDELSASYRIDKSRVFIMGFSNGAMMAHKLGALYPEKFAGIIAVSGTIGGRATPGHPFEIVPKPVMPVGVMIMHGMADDRVAYFGGVADDAKFDRFDVSADDSALYWAYNNGCAHGPYVESIDSGAVVKKTFTGCKDDSEVVLYGFEGLDHRWPKFKSINVSDVIWDFMSRHSRQP